MILRHVRQPVIGREQNRPRHPLGISSSQIRRHSSAQRFARQIDRPVRAEQSQSLVRRAK